MWSCIVAPVDSITSQTVVDEKLSSTIAKDNLGLILITVDELSRLLGWGQIEKIPSALVIAFVRSNPFLPYVMLLMLSVFPVMSVFVLTERWCGGWWGTEWRLEMGGTYIGLIDGRHRCVECKNRH